MQKNDEHRDRIIEDEARKNFILQESASLMEDEVSDDKYSASWSCQPSEKIISGAAEIMPENQEQENAPDNGQPSLNGDSFQT